MLTEEDRRSARDARARWREYCVGKMLMADERGFEQLGLKKTIPELGSFR
jgi:hypothetical protein